MRSLRRTAVLLAGSAALAASLWADAARALEPIAGVSAEDRARLAQGESVIFEQTLENDRTRYVGGVAYTLLDASADEVADVFEDPRAWRAVLPLTKSARRVPAPVVGGPLASAPSAARDFWIELRQGNALVDAVYTLRVRPAEDRRSYRFWLEPRRPHDIADAWGFFRVEPSDPTAGPRVLLTFGVLVDVGDGMVRVFEERVRPVLLGVPALVRGYVAAQYRHAKKT